MGEALQSAIIEFRIICETLFLTFIILKFTGVIGWSWWWVLSPLLAIVFLILFFLISVIITGIYGKRREKKIVSKGN